MKFYFTTICFFIYVIGFAQKSKIITGNIIDENNSPIENCLITTEKSKHSTTTDEKGNFKLEVSDQDSKFSVKYKDYNEWFDLKNKLNFKIHLYN